MIVLGFDTATAATAVGLRLADGSTIEALDDPPAGARPGHISQLLALAEGLLAEAGLTWSAIERIAVGVGPGTFTGLRIGVASARGLAHSLAVELVGVSTPRALAARAFQSGDEGLAVLAVVDARRGEVFAGAYAREGELVGVAAIPPEGLAEAIARAASTGRHWLAVGDGAIRYREQLELPGVVVAPEDSSLHRVSGGAICELGASAEPSPGQAVLPDYCRRPDAELALERATQ